MTTPIQDTTRQIGAQPGNQNRHRHGLRAGSLPRGCRYIQRQTDELRQHLEAAVIDAKGEVSVCDAASINTACRAERLAALAARWLRLSSESMNHDQRLSYAREVVRASETRDKAIRALGIDAKSGQEAMYRRLYADPFIPPPAVDAAERGAAEPTAETTAPPDATTGVPRDSGGCEISQEQGINQDTHIQEDFQETSIPNQESEL